MDIFYCANINIYPYSSAVLSDNELHEHLISIHRMSHGLLTLVTVPLHHLQHHMSVCNNVPHYTAKSTIHTHEMIQNSRQIKKQEDAAEQIFLLETMKSFFRGPYKTCEFEGVLSKQFSNTLWLLPQVIIGPHQAHRVQWVGRH